MEELGNPLNEGGGRRFKGFLERFTVLRMKEFLLASLWCLVAFSNTKVIPLNSQFKARTVLSLSFFIYFTRLWFFAWVIFSWSSWSFFLNNDCILKFICLMVKCKRSLKSDYMIFVVISKGNGKKRKSLFNWKEKRIWLGKME